MILRGNGSRGLEVVLGDPDPDCPLCSPDAEAGAGTDRKPLAARTAPVHAPHRGPLGQWLQDT